MMAIGVDSAIHLVTRRQRVGPPGHRAAIVEAVRAQPEPFDLIVFGNESADAGNYQVAIRVAHALGLPCVTGIKGDRGRRRQCPLRAGGARAAATSTSCPLPAVVTVKEGINLPRYPSVPGPAAGQAQAARRRTPSAADPRLEMVRLELPPGSGKQVAGAGQRPRRGARRRRGARGSWGWCCAVLVFIEDADRRDLPAGARAGAALGPDVAAIVIAGDGYAPAAWAPDARGARSRARARRGGRAGHRPRERGAGPRRGRCSTSRWRPTASSVTAGDPATVTRVRWGGSLLEEARVHGAPLLLTVAPHAVAAAPIGRRRDDRVDLAALGRALSRAPPNACHRPAGVSLADADVVVSGGRGVGSAEGFAIDRGARRSCSAAPSAARAR